jgi:hypothetical protein
MPEMDSNYDPRWYSQSVFSEHYELFPGGG